MPPPTLRQSHSLLVHPTAPSREAGSVDVTLEQLKGVYEDLKRAATYSTKPEPYQVNGGGGGLCCGQSANHHPTHLHHTFS